MKKYIFTLLLVLLLWSLPLTIHGEEHIFLSLDKEFIETGDELKVKVNVKDELEVKGIELYLKYDKDYIEIMDTAFEKGYLIDEEYFFTAINELQEEKEALCFMGTSLRGGEPIIGAGELLTLDFKGIKAGTTSIHLTNIKIVDGEMNTIEVKDQSIDVNIDSSKSKTNTSNDTENSNSQNMDTDQRGINIKGENVDNLIVAIGVIPTSIHGDILLISEIYDIQSTLHNGESSYKLETPIEISISYNAEEAIDEHEIGMYYYNEEKSKWIYIGGEVDEENQTVTATINHLTKFAILKNSSIKKLQDVDTHWSRPYIKRLIGMEAVAGYEDGCFKPNKHVTREEFSKILVSALDLELVKENVKFTDENEIQPWARDYVDTAYKNKILMGYEDGSFRPKAQMTRMEVAVALGKIFGNNSKLNSHGNLSDIDEAPPWALDEIKKSIALGIIHGYDDNTFKPHKPVTRGEAAKMIYMTLWELGI